MSIENSIIGSMRLPPEPKLGKKELTIPLNSNIPFLLRLVLLGLEHNQINVWWFIEMSTLYCKIHNLDGDKFKKQLLIELNQFNNAMPADPSILLEKEP